MIVTELMTTSWRGRSPLPVATAAIAFGFFRGADLGHGRVYLALGAALGALYFITVPLVVVAVGVTSIAWLRRRRDRIERQEKL